MTISRKQRAGWARRRCVGCRLSTSSSGCAGSLASAISAAKPTLTVLRKRWRVSASRAVSTSSRGLTPGDFLDRAIDELSVGRGVMALRNEPGGGLGSHISGGCAQLLDRGALLGSNLVLGHPGPPLDQGFGVGVGLGDDLVRLVPSTLEQSVTVLVGRR